MSPTTRYGVAVAAAFAGILSRLALDPMWGTALPYLTSFPAIMLSGWVGGLGPGLTTTLLSGAAATYLWVEPARSWRVGASDAFGVVVFIGVGALISGLNEAWRRAATRIALSEERLETTLRSIGDAVITTDAEGLVTSVNPVAAALTGWADAAARGRPVIEVFVIANGPPESATENPVARVLRDATVAALSNHSLLVGRDGREVPIDHTAAPIKAADGALVGVVLVFRDVTERQRGERERTAQLAREQELRLAEREARAAAERAERRLRIAIRAGGIGSWEWMIRTGRVTWSSELEAIHGVAPGTFPETIDAFEHEIHFEDRKRVMEALAGAVQHRADHHVEYRIVRADGETRWVEGHGQLFVDPNGEPERMIGVCMDITVHRLAEDALEAATREAERASELKDQFLATVSHELRSPLNAVLGWAQMLRTGMLDDTERQRAVQAVYVNAKQQTHLLDDLLDISSIVSGKLRLTRSVVDLRAVVRAALDGIKLSADAKQVTATADIDDTIDGVVGDAARLQQILFNLLMNAVKFSDEGGAVHLTVRRVAQVVEIVVTDAGEGIPADFLPRMFEPFSQADSSTTRAHGGLGVGLAIVKHLVDAHGGTIGAESAGEEQGARFTVRLPIVAAYGEDASSVSLPSDHPRGHVLSLHNVRILVVDDNADSRDLVASIMEAAHATVGTATSAAEALAKLQRDRVDVLLADIAMPGEDGYGLIAKVRALDSAARAVPAIALTAFAGQNDRQEALRAGFHAHVSKPVDAHTLIEAVAGLVNRIASY